MTVEFDGPALVSDNGCTNLTPSDMNCSFNIVEGGMYMVRLNTISHAGTTSNEDLFDCKWYIHAHVIDLILVIAYKSGYQVERP